MKLIKFRTSTGTRVLHLREEEKKPEEETIKTGFIQPLPGPAMFFQKGMMQNPEQPEVDDYMKQIPAVGIEIPQISETEVSKEEMPEMEEKDQSTIELKYPLIPANPRQGEKVFAYAQIYWDQKERELIYRVMEPLLDERTEKTLNDIKEYVQEKIDIDFTQIKKKEATGYLEDVFQRALYYFHINDPEGILRYYIFRDFVGLEKIEPLLKDSRIEDISCDGIGIPIYVYHRDPRIGSIKTNIIFDTKLDLDSFTNKLAERCGKVISVAKPMLDATLPDGSRVQATLSSDIARQGSNFTIRMFTENPLTPTDIIKFGTCDIKLMSYLWYMIEHGKSMLISGGTATGKTSLLNVLSLFIKPQMKIVSIEDTAELRLPHPHWVPEVARSPIAQQGAIDMYELLRESLRQRPDYIIVGEVRGKEAYVLFQQMAVGHPGLSTIHSENFAKLLDRLTTPPISLPLGLIQNLDVIIFLKRVKKGTKYFRRINSVVEVLGFDRKNNMPITNKIFEWDAKTDTYVPAKKSKLLKKIVETTEKTDEDIKEDIEKRAKVIKWLYDMGINDYIKVGKVLNLFYSSQEMLLSKIEGTI